MKYEFTKEELEQLMYFVDGRGVCFDEWDGLLLQKLSNYISIAEALEDIPRQRTEKFHIEVEREKNES